MIFVECTPLVGLLKAREYNGGLVIKQRVIEDEWLCFVTCNSPQKE